MKELKNTSDVLIGGDQVLVTEIKDYYRSNKPGDKESFELSENNSVCIGYIEKSGKDVVKNMEGCIVHYMQGTFSRLNIKGVGKFHLVDIKMIHAIIRNQNLNNY